MSRLDHKVTHFPTLIIHRYSRDFLSKLLTETMQVSSRGSPPLRRLDLARRRQREGGWNRGPKSLKSRLGGESGRKRSETNKETYYNIERVKRASETRAKGLESRRVLANARDEERIKMKEREREKKKSLDRSQTTN